MVLIKPFVEEARAIVQAVPVHPVRALSKGAARPLRQRCMAWLTNAPLDSSMAVFSAWGSVVAALVYTEDILRAGVASIKHHRAPEELMRWLNTMAALTPQELFSTYRGRHALYASVCRCAQALRGAKRYSVTLHDTLAEHRWSPGSFLFLLARCRDAHRNFRKKTQGEQPACPEDTWIEALLAVARYTSWRAGDHPMLHALWGALPMFARPVAVKTVERKTYDLVMCWDSNDTEMEALIVKLAATMPDSAAAALDFAQAYPLLISPPAFEAIARLDLSKTSSVAGLYAWLHMHTNPNIGKMPLRTMLEGKYPEMAKTLRSYMQIVPPGQEYYFALELLPAWRQWVCGIEPVAADEIPGDLFSG